jgi:hypothetical protein
VFRQIVETADDGRLFRIRERSASTNMDKMDAWDRVSELFSEVILIPYHICHHLFFHDCDLI